MSAASSDHFTPRDFPDPPHPPFQWEMSLHPGLSPINFPQELDVLCCIHILKVELSFLQGQSYLQTNLLQNI
jgi:hypothetical protein